MKVTVLSGGVGGARFLLGLTTAMEPADLTVVGNVGDDLELWGLHISPDLDSVLYTLLGVADAERGWGRSDETWNAWDTVRELGGDAWFMLGDRDLGQHLVRTELLRGGATLAEATAELAGGAEFALLPATNDRLRTWIATDAGEFPFQRWFVARRHEDEVNGVRFEGAEEARAAPGVLEALAEADLIVLAPSNPYVSIAPILAVREIREAIENRRVPCVAVSPLIAGRAIKGPADRMLARLAGGTSPDHVASCYQGLIDVLVIDPADAAGEVSIRMVVTPTLMSTDTARRRLAEAVLDVARVAA